MTTLIHPFEISCPSCLTVFPVDPRRVPSEGVHAVCSICARTFLVSLPEELPDEAPEEVHVTRGEEDVFELEELEAEVQAPDAAETPADPGSIDLEDVPSEDAPSSVQTLEREWSPEPDEDEVDLSSLATEAIEDDPPTDPAGEVRGKTLSEGVQKFGRRDPSDRARRLARVLVSDMIAYHPARYRESLERGTLKEDFEDEVQRSWEEYVEQIGEELAESTPFFTDALNEILAKGEKIF